MKTDYRSDCRQVGVTLIELLIGLAVGLFIILAATSVFTGTLRSSKQNLKMTHLDQQLRAAMDVMTRHIRRAGYTGRPPATTTGEVDLLYYGPYNPFQTGNGRMTLGGTCDGTTGECTCITFTYDGDADGVLDISSGSTDLYGFQYNSGAIEMWKGTSTLPSCGTDASYVSYWEDITDPTVVVDKLRFQYQSRDASDPTKPLALNLTVPSNNSDTACNTSSTCACTSDDPPCDPVSCPCGCPLATGEECLQLRTLLITVDGHLTSDDNTTMSIRERVKVRNDRYCIEGGTGSPGSPSCTL
jgi:type II secretory pathway component PulJ